MGHFTGFMLDTTVGLGTTGVGWEKYPQSHPFSIAFPYFLLSPVDSFLAKFRQRQESLVASLGCFVLGAL